jgi:hypothetical protein
MNLSCTHVVIYPLLKRPVIWTIASMSAAQPYDEKTQQQNHHQYYKALPGLS